MIHFQTLQVPRKTKVFGEEETECSRPSTRKTKLEETKEYEKQKSSLAIIRALSIPVGEHDVFQRVILSQFELISVSVLYELYYCYS